MPRDRASLRRAVARVREAWHDLSAWRRPHRGARPSVDFGRCPIRPAICDPARATEQRETRSIDAAREELTEVFAGWPSVHARLAIEGDTGIGKTTMVIEKCADHVVGTPELWGALLLVVHDRARVVEMLDRVRTQVMEREGDPSRVADLLGKQGKQEGAVRFGCANYEQATQFGRRGRQVEKEVCDPCFSRGPCLVSGFLAHTQEALKARVIVTTLAKLRGLSKEVWDVIGGVICDEDVMRGLLRETTVKYAMLGRIRRYIDSLRGTRARSAHGRAMRAVGPLVDGMLAAVLDREVGFTAALVDVLPEECDRYATQEGLTELRAAMPTSLRRVGNGEWASLPDPRAPARWEYLREDHVPRQVWGRLLEAYMADVHTGGGGECTTIHVERTSPAHGFARLVFLRFDERAIEHLQARPLLILDATLHLGVGPVLNVERREIRYDQGRTIVQVIGPLLRLCDLRVKTEAGYVLTGAGRRVVAQLAGWFTGRRGHVLVRKDLVPLLTAEARRYHELRRITFTSPGRERGWDAGADAIVFAGLGRYAKSGSACELEARALRSFVRGMTGSTERLDVFAVGPRALVYKGRGQPVRYRGELVERVMGGPKDRLAAAIQEADRVATVRQFIGRNRTGTSEILLLRGDATVGADVLIEERDLPLAVPISTAGPGGKHQAPSTGNDLWPPGTPHLPPVSGLTASLERSGCLPEPERRCAQPARVPRGPGATR